MDASLDAVTVRFNRRTSRSRGKRFSCMLQQANVLGPSRYDALVGGRAIARGPELTGSPIGSIPES